MDQEGAHKLNAEDAQERGQANDEDMDSEDMEREKK